MQVKKIEGCTRVIGEAQGYIGLPLRDILINDSVTGADTPAMESEWEPDAVERELIASGASLILRVVGKGHPPVMISVGDPPKPAGDQTELHNQLVHSVIAQLMRPLRLEGGGTADVMVLTESVLVGVAMMCIRLGGDEHVLELMFQRARQRLAELRLADLPTAGQA